MTDESQRNKRSLKHVVEAVRQEVRNSPDWLREIYQRNRTLEEHQRAERERAREATNR